VVGGTTAVVGGISNGEGSSPNMAQSSPFPFILPTLHISSQTSFSHVCDSKILTDGEN
jgi:hypothetical protein